MCEPPGACAALQQKFRSLRHRRLPLPSCLSLYRARPCAPPCLRCWWLEALGSATKGMSRSSPSSRRRRWTSGTTASRCCSRGWRPAAQMRPRRASVRPSPALHPLHRDSKDRGEASNQARLHPLRTCCCDTGDVAPGACATGIAWPRRQAARPCLCAPSRASKTGRMHPGG